MIANYLYFRIIYIILGIPNYGNFHFPHITEKHYNYLYFNQSAASEVVKKVFGRL